jgi:hypothetical protein
MVRDDLRRERRMQRLHYEEMARNHNIEVAAKKLLEDQQREASAEAQTIPYGADSQGRVPAIQDAKWHSSEMLKVASIKECVVARSGSEAGAAIHWLLASCG